MNTSPETLFSDGLPYAEPRAEIKLGHVGVGEHVLASTCKSARAGILWGGGFGLSIRLARPVNVKTWYIEEGGGK